MDYNFTIPDSAFTELKSGQRLFSYEMKTGGTGPQLQATTLRQGDTVTFNVPIPPGVSVATWTSQYTNRVVVMSANNAKEVGTEEFLWPIGFSQVIPQPDLFSLPAVTNVQQTKFKIRPLQDTILLNVTVIFGIADAGLYEAWRTGSAPPVNMDYKEFKHEYMVDPSGPPSAFISFHQQPLKIATSFNGTTYDYATFTGFQNQANPDGVAGCAIGFGTGGCAFPGGGSILLPEPTNYSWSANMWKVYIPRGTKGLNLVGFLPQGAQAAYVMRFGQEPSRTTPLSGAEYSAAQVVENIDRSFKDLCRDSLELIHVHDGGGTLRMVGGTLGAFNTGDQNKSMDAGGWLYFRQLNGSGLFSYSGGMDIDMPKYAEAYASMGFNGQGDPTGDGRNGLLMGKFPNMPSGQYRILIPRGAKSWDIDVTTAATGDGGKAWLAVDAPPVREETTLITDPEQTLTKLWALEKLKAEGAPGSSTFAISTTSATTNTFLADRSRWLYLDVDYPEGKAMNVESRIKVIDMGGGSGVITPVTKPSPLPPPQKPLIDFPAVQEFPNDFPPKEANKEYVNAALDLAVAGNMVRDPVGPMCQEAESKLDVLVDAMASSPYAANADFQEFFDSVMSFTSFSRDMQTVTSNLFANPGDRRSSAVPYSFAVNTPEILGKEVPTVNSLLSVAQYNATSSYYGERSVDACASIREMAGNILQLGTEMVAGIGSMVDKITGLLATAGQSISEIMSAVGEAVAGINQIMSNMINGALTCVSAIANATEQLVRESTAGLINAMNQLNPCASAVLLGNGIDGAPGILTDEMSDLVREAPLNYNLDD